MTKQAAILIVDDREENLLALERILAQTDATIVRAQNGNDALKACLNHDFALALLDVNMPDMNGYELAELMRGGMDHSATPIIFLTAAYSREEQIFKGYSSGAVDYMVKPISSGILLNKVKVFLDIYRQKQELILLNHECVRAREAAEAANDAKSAFLAIMSHEIRTPLTGISGMVQLLMETEMSQEQQKYAEIVHESSDHMLTIINDVLDLSKIEAGQMTLEQTEFNLVETLRSATAMLVHAARRKGLELITQVEEGVPAVLCGDPVRLRQIVMNLVGNAIKFTAAGEVSIGVRICSEDEHSVRVHFTIRDSGIGISQEAIGNIFRPYTQADSSTARIYGGTGLGLSICKSLVELFSGEIGAESGQDGGATFWFTAVFGKKCAAGDASLTIVPENQCDQKSAPATKLSGKRLLVVEDDPINRKLMVLLIGNMGYLVDAVDTGSGAIEALGETPYDLVLMDFHMPDMDGFQASRAIRFGTDSLPASNVPIIAVTGCTFHDDLESCYNAGMNDYICKPLKIEEMKEKIEKWLSVPPAAG